MIAIAIIAIIIDINRPEAVLKGTFVYDDSTKYEFDGRRKGAMIIGDSSYEYTYSVEGDTLKMDFVDERNVDATYTFKIENDVLTLVGGEGTTGRRI